MGSLRMQRAAAPVCCCERAQVNHARFRCSFAGCSQFAASWKRARTGRPESGEAAGGRQRSACNDLNRNEQAEERKRSESKFSSESEREQLGSNWPPPPESFYGRFGFFVAVA